MEGNSRKTANHYGLPYNINNNNLLNQPISYYKNSYACSNGGPVSIYNGICQPGIPSSSGISCIQNYHQYNHHNQFHQNSHQLHEDYRPIYFYVAQPYTIPYTLARRPKKPSSLQKPGKQRTNYRVKFSKKLSTAEFSEKVKQGEFSKSLSQVSFDEAEGQGI